MFSEVLKITPQLDSGALAKMESSLSGRFKKVAKGFGKGLIGAISGGGVLGIATSVIDKFLNPLKETQEAIDRTLHGANQTQTNAEQFGATSGQLFKLEKLAQAKGVDAGELGVLLTKYQAALAEAKADPTKVTSVRKFANDTNSVDSFFQFIQNLNKLPRDQQVRVQGEVFGEKQTLKMAEFLRADFGSLEKKLGAHPADFYTHDINKLGDLDNRASEKRAGMELQDIHSKGQRITGSMVDARAQADQLELRKENERIANFQNLQSLSNTAEKINGLVEKGVFLIGDTITKVTPMISRLADNVEGLVNSFKKSSVFRFFGGKDDK